MKRKKKIDILEENKDFERFNQKDNSSSNKKMAKSHTKSPKNGGPWKTEMLIYSLYQLLLNVPQQKSAK